MFERFTDSARRVVVLAQEQARDLGHDYIGTEHLLLGLLVDPNSAAASVLTAQGVSAEAVRGQVESIIGRGQSPSSGHMPFTVRAKKVLELSLREALELGQDYIGTEHLLLGVIREGEGVATQVLVNLGSDLDQTRQALLEILPEQQRQLETVEPRPDPNDHLRAEVARLRRLLTQHGIDPDDAAGRVS